MKKFSFYFFVKELFLGALNALVMVTAGVIIAGFLIYHYQTPSADRLVKQKMPETSILYDRTGTQVLYEIHGEENRKKLYHSQIPDVVRSATIAAEDKSFYRHRGIDVFSILRALKVNIENNSVLQGGSTITQQLARNVFLTREKTLARKFVEAILAIKIERYYSKDDILDFYLNDVPYGSNAYGVQAAAETFFGKDAENLTLEEAALIAALPKAPTHYSPYGLHQEELIARQRAILKKMYVLEFINNESLNQAFDKDILAEVVPFRQPIQAPHFVFYALSDLEEKYGKEFLETGGLRIYTTLDYDMQQAAEKAVEEGAVRNRAHGANNAALVALNPKNGEVLAMVGSKDYFDESIDGQVNVTLRSRQPGSSFKPIVYATAFEKGLQPETMIADEPTNFGPDGSGKNYIPRNYDGKFHGVLPMRKTLAMSLNIPAIKTLAAVGIPSAIDMGQRLGITTLSPDRKYGLSMAIGGAEVKPIDLTSAFSVFANDGKRNQPRAISKITQVNGKEFALNWPSETQVIDPQIARKINSILSDNDARAAIFGPNSPLYIPGMVVAAKTGTTQEFRDAWTVGYTPSIAVGVWAGNNDNRPMKAGSDGVFVAAPIWRSFMNAALPRLQSESFFAYTPSKIINQPFVLGASDEKNTKDKHDKKKKK